MSLKYFAFNIFILSLGISIGYYGTNYLGYKISGKKEEP